MPKMHEHDTVIPESCRVCALGSRCPADDTIPRPDLRSPAPDAAPSVSGLGFQGTAAFPQGLMMGLDVGSTTVKAVVIDPVDGRVLWQDYQRHETRQPEKALEFVTAIATAFPDVPPNALRLFVTGSGGAALTRHIGGKFVQEVNAVALTVEQRFPQVHSVVELGGQDAKIIIFKDLGGAGHKKIPSMNDKCAGGTGAVIDKIAAKLKIPQQELGTMSYRGVPLHAVAGKCGVFAETDINSLQKQGVPAAELMASLFEAIVQQNLTVLARGHTLMPDVLLLGGPNSFLPGLREAWQANIAALWKERSVELPDPKRSAESYVITPDDAVYFAALGAVEFGRREVEDDANTGLYRGPEPLRRYIEHGRTAERMAPGLRGLAHDPGDLARFLERYRPEPWEPARYAAGEVVEAFLGIDGGSTSTKAVLLDRQAQVLAKSYMLSRGNPIEDTIEVIADLQRQVCGQDARLTILGAATTGYAKDVLRDVLAADVALVETVAHTHACLHYYPDADVIVDVGGQDIKLIMLKDGRVKDFKLNTQCSAGNGFFLQSTAQAFGYEVRDYADSAFSARAMPEFGYGCAVFMQSDIVDFQRQGWRPEEIMAGLAAVLPKNIWLYVAQITNLASLGSTFILQGGTQHNLAAVKAQVDFIERRFAGTGVEPTVLVHRHCGESGAIGCAMEARRLWNEQRHQTTFIGLERVRKISFRTTHNENTRCYFCRNRCVRTFVDVNTGAAETAGRPTRLGRTTAAGGDGKVQSKVPLPAGYQRLIIASCEKGTVEDIDDMRQIKAGLDTVMDKNPDFTEIASRTVFHDVQARDVTSSHFGRGRRARRRTQVRIGIPRVLGMYGLAPFFIGYFTALGVPFRNLVFSDYTDQELYRRGAKRGSVDPCFPSKLAIAHIHDLLFNQHRKKPLTHIFFPMINSFPTALADVLAAKSCPTGVSTVDAAHAAFVKEKDLFAANGITFKRTFVCLDAPRMCARQLYRDWQAELDVSLRESERAVDEGLRALGAHREALRRRSGEVLDTLEAEGRIGIVALSRPYHNDPGVNHGILTELQKRGYPIFWQDALPREPWRLDRLFGDEVRAGVVRSPLSIDDVWKNSFLENSSRKLWAAKYAARHPNLVAVELSSFKCGHDAPIYSVVEQIVEAPGTPFFAFRDIDENRPAGSIKVRIETIIYFLARYQERLVTERRQRAEIEQHLRRYGNAPKPRAGAGPPPPVRPELRAESHHEQA